MYVYMSFSVSFSLSLVRSLSFIGMIDFYTEGILSY